MKAAFDPPPPSTSIPPKLPIALAMLPLLCPALAEIEPIETIVPFEVKDPTETDPAEKLPDPFLRTIWLATLDEVAVIVAELA